jgi:hypothetical protein
MNENERCCNNCIFWIQSTEHNEYGYCSMIEKSLQHVPCWFRGMNMRIDGGNRCLCFKQKDDDNESIL